VTAKLPFQVTASTRRRSSSQFKQEPSGGLPHLVGTKKFQTPFGMKDGVVLPPTERRTRSEDT
jgi:hypothetical protein